MLCIAASWPWYAVALLAEGVDRNLFHSAVLYPLAIVALLAEGVDRNRFRSADSRGAALVVALLAEGVDRNSTRGGAPAALPLSPSSRRAWIEIGRA